MSESRHDDARGCRNSGLPLGGLGTGGLEIRPDGGFYNWTLMNCAPWASGPATTHMDRTGLRFVVCVDDGERRWYLNLGLPGGLDPGLDAWYWISDPYHVPWVAHAEDIVYRARFPRAELEYRFADAPVAVTLEAWSPFVPHDVAASNTPGAVLGFRFVNRTRRPLAVGLLALVKNPVGYDHPDLPCAATLIREPGLFGAVLTRPGLPERCNSRGSLAFCFSDDGASDASWVIHPRNGRDVWDPLFQAGRLDDCDASNEGGTVGEIGAERALTGPTGHPRVALCRHLRLPVDGEAQTTGLLTWHFPCFLEQERDLHPTAEAPQRCCQKRADDIGVQYAHRFADAVAVARHLHAQRTDLQRRTRAWSEAFFASSLPAWELDAVATSLTVLQRSSWYDRDGRFGIWEGQGCCGLQTIDVGHYSSWSVLQFFPELDRSQNRLSAANRAPGGKVPHLMPGNFSACDGKPGERGRIDLGAQFVLAVWRHALWTGDLDEARRLWPILTANLDWLAATDDNGDGLPDNRGPDQTYDRFPIHGTGAFVAGLYLAALRAVSDLATRLGLEAEAAAYRSKAEAGMAIYHKQLWNGSYYNLSFQADENLANTGCMTDQVNADWFLRQSGGPGLLPDARVRSCLKAVLAHNRRSCGSQAWLANCSWPQGGGITITRRGSDQVNAPWSGVEYAFAAHLRLMGQMLQARRVAKDIYARYDEAGMRYNHIECGQYYYRWMSAWALYQAEFGLAWEAPSRRLSLTLGKDAARLLCVLPTATATLAWDPVARRLTATGLDGRQEVTVLRLNGSDRVLPEPLRLAAGETASVALA